MQKRWVGRWAAAMLLSALVANSLPACAAKAVATKATSVQASEAPSAAMVEAYFHRLFGYDSSLQTKVLKIAPSPAAELYEVRVQLSSPKGQQVTTWYVTRDLKHALLGELMPFGDHPYQASQTRLAAEAFGATAGPRKAKLLIVEFADLECPACREAATLMARLRADFPEARFVFQNYPIANLHPWATPAAAYLDCLTRQAPQHALAFVDLVYEHQREIEEEVRQPDAEGKVHIDEAAVQAALRRYAEWTGADGAKIAACALLPETAERVQRSRALGDALGVTATPTLFINGRRMIAPSSQQYEGLKNIVNFEQEMAQQDK